MEQQVKSLIEQGYAVTSRRHRHVSRIDRKDWREYMAKQHCPWSFEEGMQWVEGLGRCAADQYRRVYSKDTLVVSNDLLRMFPTSAQGPTHYKHK